ncbi:MAG: serine--tRNA ligase, partial [Candidatus Thermoplasmatota archaeon]|nr:serine--tRNA ligase [Candidatus Thermoplasmatota archaeon]
MHFDLECTFTLSKAVDAPDDVEAFLASFVQEANDDLLQRGARDCGPDITDWKLQHDAIDMRIVSTG